MSGLLGADHPAKPISMASQARLPPLVFRILVVKLDISVIWQVPTFLLMHSQFKSVVFLDLHFSLLSSTLW